MSEQAIFNILKLNEGKTFKHALNMLDIAEKHIENKKLGMRIKLCGLNIGE